MRSSCQWFECHFHMPYIICHMAYDIWHMEMKFTAKILPDFLSQQINIDSETFLQGTLIDRLSDGGVLRGVAD